MAGFSGPFALFAPVYGTSGGKTAAYNVANSVSALNREDVWCSLANTL